MRIEADPQHVQTCATFLFPPTPNGLQPDGNQRNLLAKIFVSGTNCNPSNSRLDPPLPVILV